MKTANKPYMPKCDNSSCRFWLGGMCVCVANGYELTLDRDGVCTTYRPELPAYGEFTKEDYDEQQYELNRHDF